MIRRGGDNTSTKEDRCLELSLALLRKFIMFCNSIVICNVTTMLCLLVVYSVTGRVDSVTTSAVKSLDAWSKSLHASAKYFGRVGEILGRVGEIFWTRRRRFGRLGGTRLVASARIPLQRQFFGRLGI